MPYVLVIHKVQDIARWRPFFEADKPRQQAAGLTVRHVFRDADDPQEVVILFEAANLGRAREFVGSEGLRKIMEEAGVLGRPEIHFLDTAGRWFSAARRRGRLPPDVFRLPRGQPRGAPPARPPSSC